MREYHIINGSSGFFRNQLSQLDLDKCAYFYDLVKLNDERKNQKKPFDSHAHTMIVPNHNYHGIVSTAHDRLGPLIEELTFETAEIYIHNPPRGLLEFLQGQQENQLISVSSISEEYHMSVSSNEFSRKMLQISHEIIGQDTAIEDISKSMWYLITSNRKKPYVLMLYGSSSLGKTEVIKQIAKHFYDEKHYEKHLSMFKNNTYADYFFGEDANRKSIGYDLLERESNLVFFDELDKCPEYFYSAFYTLFDNTVFKDAAYDVNIDGLFIVCTSNYTSESDIKKHLGLPIYYRIDKFIHFEEFTPQSIYTVTMNEIERRKEEYQDRLTSQQIYKVVGPMIKTKGENGRTIQQKVQKVIEELLFLKMKESINDKE